MIQESCCFTGHRPMRLPFGFDEQHPMCLALKKVLEMEITRKIESGCTAFYSGSSWGTDLLCSEIVLALRERHPAVRLVSVIPHEAQAARWDEETRERYFAILEQSDDNVYISRRHTSTCYLERNRYLIDQSRHVIAVFDGKPGGGADHTLAYAREKGREIVIIHPQDLTVRREDGVGSRLRIIQRDER